MTTPNQILADLRAGQTTTDALAETLRIPTLTVKAMCERHEKDGLLVRSTVAGVVVWSLTATGRETAGRLPIPATT